MDGSKDSCAREFWKRFDDARGKRTVKEIAECLDIQYDLISVQRSRHRLPKIDTAVALARELDTTVEYLVTGVEPPRSATSDLQRAYQESDDTIKQIVRIALKLDQKQTEKREIV